MLLLLIICVVIVYVLYSWLSLLRDGKLLDVSGPMPFPIVGNTPLFIGDTENFLKQLCRISDQYGGTARFHILTDRYLLIAEPKMMEAVTTSNELITKGTSYNFVRPWLGTGLLTSTGHKWRTHRKFLTPAFHFNILRNFLPVFLKNDAVFIEKLCTLADGSPIDLFPLVALLALDNTTESIMGVSFNAQNNKESKYVKAIKSIGEIILMRIRNPIGRTDLGFSWMPDKKIHDDVVKILHEESRAVIEARRQELKRNNIDKLEDTSEIGIKNRYSFMDLLLLAEVDGKKLDDETIREEVDTFMFEGHDTTTTGIAYTLFCISNHEDVQEKILKEQKEILGDIFRDPSYSEIQQMKYLDSVIKEAHRIYPPVPLIERKVLKDTHIGGMFVPRDTNLLLNFFYLHRHPNSFENPLEFRPERFDASLKNPFSWLPFSAGPRNCIGQKFAMLEMKAAVASVVKHFILLPSDIEPMVCSELVLRSKNGVNVRLLPRPVIK